VRLRKPAPTVTPSGLLSDLARGPDPRVWCPHHRGELARGLSEPFCDYRARQAWRAGGDAWSVQHGLGRDRWRELLSAEVRYVVSPRGRLMPPEVLPWERS
jgi:hypothetical protein